MNISITPELEQLVNTKVKSGMYQSASEVIREALRLLAERDEMKSRRIEKMDAFLQDGLDDIERGDVLSPEELKAGIDRLFSELKQRNG